MGREFFGRCLLFEEAAKFLKCIDPDLKVASINGLSNPRMQTIKDTNPDQDVVFSDDG